MKIKLVLSCILCICGFVFQVGADDLSPVDQEALEDTKALLNDPKRLEEVKSKNDKANSVDKNIDALGFSAQEKKEIYGLSSEIFEQLVKETNGDPEKMKKLLSEAMKDPAGFAKKWSPEQKAKLKAISSGQEKRSQSPKKP